jgi:hypothetical protein
MARKDEFAEWDAELNELEARYQESVRESGWSPGIDGVVRTPKMGRPRLGERRIALTVTLSPLAVATLDEMSERYHLTRGRIVDRLLEGCARKPEAEAEENESKSKLKGKRR